MIIDKRSANAVRGRTARACDSCGRRRARWYCTADDAFLCQSCDTSVHSANQLASRHERVRLGTSNFKNSTREDSMPAWHQGFTKKARTRRHTNKLSHLSMQEAKNEEKFFNPLPLVPEINGSEETSPFDENNHEEQVSYQVPVFDPFASGHEGMDYEHGAIDDLERFLLPSDMELAEFAADVESLLGGDLKKERYDEKGGLHFCHDQGGRVKVEDEDEGEIEAVLACQFDPMTIDVMRETFDWNFDYESPMNGEEVEEEKVVGVVKKTITNNEIKADMRKKISLKLNYEEVITSWANQKSPWTTGIRPEFNPDDCWPEFMGMCPTNFHHHNGDIGGVGGQVGGAGDGEREARVSRYREKRRTRLFSKKIRYEVRKLNAEKRPRMRGRFVKRTSFAVPNAFPKYLNN